MAVSNTEWQTIVLTAIVDVEEHLQTLPRRWEPGTDRFEWARVRMLTRPFDEERLVPYKLTLWLGRSPLPRESVAVSRAVKQLERRGLLERHCLDEMGGRAAFVRLTAAGREESQRLYGKRVEAEKDAACEAIQT